MIRRFLILYAVMAALPGMAAQRLNNFVTELVRIEEATPGAYDFSVEHETWLYVRVTSSEAVSVILNDGSESLPLPEAMQFVGPGTHSISIDSTVSRLEVRAIPDIMYCSFPYHPLVYHMGPYDWPFLEKQVLPHVTTVVGTRDRDQSRYAIPWRAQGKRWIVQVPAPGLKTGEAPPIEEIVREFTGRFDETPYLDGILIDEYFPRLKNIFDPSAEALSLIASNPAYAGRTPHSLQGTRRKWRRLSVAYSPPAAALLSKRITTNSRRKRRRSPTWRNG